LKKVRSQGGQIYQTVAGRFSVLLCVYGEVNIFSMADHVESLRAKDYHEQGVPYSKAGDLKYKEGSLLHSFNEVKNIINRLVFMKVSLDNELQVLLLLSSFLDSWEALMVSLSNSMLGWKISISK